MLRYFNFEPSFELRWRRARDLFGSQIRYNSSLKLDSKLKYLNINHLLEVEVSQHKSPTPAVR